VSLFEEAAGLQKSDPQGPMIDSHKGPVDCEWTDMRRAASPHAVVADLRRRIGLTVQNRPLETVVEQSLEISWTRDVFDRAIVAQAALDGAILLTTDRAIRKYYPKAVW